MAIDSTYLPCLRGYIVMCVDDAARRKEFEVPKRHMLSSCVLCVLADAWQLTELQGFSRGGFPKRATCIGGSLGSLRIPASGNAITSAGLSAHTIVETSSSMLPIYRESHVSLTS